MATAALPQTWTNGDVNDGSEPLANDVYLQDFINTNAIQKDGSLAMTAALTLVGADPTAANHAVRKSYSDDGPPSLQIDLTALTNTAGSAGPSTWDAAYQAFANPSRAVKVASLIIGYIDIGSNQRTLKGELKVEISSDGGATWGSSGAFQAGSVYRDATVAVATTQIVAVMTYSGTPTGAIHVRARTQITGSTPSDATWTNGRILSVMIPN